MHHKSCATSNVSYIQVPMTRRCTYRLLLRNCWPLGTSERVPYPLAYCYGGGYYVDVDGDTRAFNRKPCPLYYVPSWWAGRPTGIREFQTLCPSTVDGGEDYIGIEASKLSEEGPSSFCRKSSPRVERRRPLMTIELELTVQFHELM